MTEVLYVNCSFNQLLSVTDHSNLFFSFFFDSLNLNVCVQDFSHVIVSLVHSGVEERNQVIMLTCVRGRLWSFMMFVSSQPKCSVSVFTLNKVNRNHGCRLILFKPNLIQIFHGLNLFLWDIWGEVYLDSCTTGASAESTGFWFLLNVECWFSACSRVSLTRSHTLPEFWFCRKTDISVVKKRKWSYVFTST